MRGYIAILILVILATTLSITWISPQPTKVVTAQETSPSNLESDEVEDMTLPEEEVTFSEEGLPQHTGRYSNPIYYFSVAIPPGLIGYTAPDPAPEHGIAIPLSKKPDTWVYAGAGYNVTFLESLDDVADQNLEWIKDRGAEVEVIKREQTFLKELQAIRLTVRYKEKKSGRIRIEDEVIALREEPGNTELIYEITLYTTEDRYYSDVGAFEQILNGWKLKRIPSV